MGKKVIFLDVDGTLTEPGSNEPPASALWAIEQVRRQGHYVFLCSGRSYGMLAPLLKYDFDGAVASAGGYIMCRDRVIYDCPMSKQQKQAAMDTLRECGIYRTIECRDSSYTDAEFKEFLRTHAAEGKNSEMLRWREQIERSLNILPMERYGGEPAYKIVVMSPSREQLLEAEKVLSSDFSFCIQDENRGGFVNGELINRSFDKGRGVARVCEYLGIPAEDSIAFGDSMNDREMLEAAGLSICMANGSEEMKRLADDVCPSVGEHGIREALIRHHLISGQEGQQRAAVIFEGNEIDTTKCTN